MNKSLLLVSFTSLLALGVFLCVPNARAGYYPDNDGTPLKVGDCTLVNDKSQASDTQVYTLSPSDVVSIYYKYFQYFRRPARCEELQFHVDHNNSVKKVEKWLLKTVTNRIKSGYYNGNTVVTKTRSEWFWVENNVAHRIPDWLTGLSNGFIISDHILLSATLSNLFYHNVAIGAPVAFGDGAYADKITSIWKNGDRDYTSLPQRLAEEISLRESKSNVFTQCVYRSYYSYDQRYEVSLDWSWMLHNPGCILADS